MNEQATQDNNPSAPTILPAKRRRGRPRKDGGVAKRGNLQSPVMTTPAPESIKKVQQNAVEVNQKDGIIGSNNGVGQMVSGVVDGRFDAGYFITVKVGNSGTTLRGLVFQPGRFSPITPANDVAPSATMYHRNQVASTLLNQLQQEKQQPNVALGQQVLPSNPMSGAPFISNTNQFAPVMAPSNASSPLGEKIMLQPPNQDQRVQINQSHLTIPVENLRMVEKDEVMQVFEMSNQSEGTKMVADSILEPKASDGTSNQVQAQNQLMGSMFQPNILFHGNQNSSSGEIHHNPVVSKSQEALDNEPIESESKNDKQPNPDQSYMQTLLQPGELVHCEAKKLEIHRAPPVNAQTQLYSFQGLPPMNEEIQLKEWTHGGQENQQNQFIQSTLFAELNSVSPAAETQVQPSNELKSTFLEQNYDTQMTQALEGGANENPNPEINQVLVAGETQVVPEESIRTTSMDFMMKNLNYPKNDEPQNTHNGTEVDLSRNVKTSNETKEASDPPGDKLVLGSQLSPQQEEAETDNSDHSAKLETQNKSCDGGNINLEMFHQVQP